jgi:hypothetical protein
MVGLGMFGLLAVLIVASSVAGESIVLSPPYMQSHSMPFGFGVNLMQVIGHCTFEQRNSTAPVHFLDFLLIALTTLETSSKESCGA